MSSEEEALFGPGGLYEIAEEPVMGISMPVFRNRMRSARELLQATEKFGDRVFLVQEGGWLRPPNARRNEGFVPAGRQFHDNRGRF